MFDRHRQKAVVLFALADVILTVCAFEAAYQTRVALPLPRVFFIVTPVKALLLGGTLALWLGIGAWLGVYHKLYGNNTRAAIRDTFLQVFLGVVGLVTFQYLLDPQLDISRLFIGLFAAYNLVFLLVYRVSAGRLRGFIRRQFGAQTFYLVVGCGPKAREMGRGLEAAREYGVQLVGFVDPVGSAGSKIDLGQTYPVRKLDELAATVREHVIDEIIFAVEAEKLAALEDVLLICDEEGIRTRVMMDIFPHIQSKVYVERFSDVPMLTFSTTPHDEIRLFLKRSFDVTLGVISLLALALPMALLALMIRLTSRGPGIFRQVRGGLNGRRFVCYKFRSMVANAEKLRGDLAHLNEKDGPVFKIADDPRLTTIGRYLRRFSIDELPQLWNILKGDMSFVGPRPAVLSEIQQYKTWQRRRLRMRPGLTCLWAVQGRDSLRFDTWMKLDLEYIDKWSLWLDFKLLVQSIPRVLVGRGAN